jgi:hypothetical protein
METDMRGFALMLVLSTLVAPACARSAEGQARGDSARLAECVHRKQGPEGDLMTATRSGVALSEETRKAVAESGDPKDCVGLISRPCEEAGGKACEAREARGWEQAIRDLRSAAMKPMDAARAAALAKSARAHAERFCAATDRGLKDACVTGKIAVEFIALMESDRL